MVYGTAQAGFNPPPNQGLNIANLEVGDSITLFSGTETPSNGLASVSFARGYSPGAMDNGTTFNVQGAASGTKIDVQVAANDVDGDYTSVTTITPDASGNGVYTDIARNAFYRVKISAYTSGAMPVVTAQR